jgi:hypothetical protein
MHLCHDIQAVTDVVLLRRAERVDRDAGGDNVLYRVHSQLRRISFV